MNDKERHLLHYLILVLGLILFALLLIFFKHNTLIQLLVTGLCSVFYASWGIMHHAVENRLTKAIAFEYILIGGFVFLVIFTALNL